MGYRPSLNANKVLMKMSWQAEGVSKLQSYVVQTYNFKIQGRPPGILSNKYYFMRHLKFSAAVLMEILVF
jgi:hypothetical protein